MSPQNAEDESRSETPSRCETNRCHREPDHLFVSDLDEDGNLLPEGEETKRAFCTPCKLAAEWTDAWTQSERGWEVL